MIRHFRVTAALMLAAAAASCPADQQPPTCRAGPFMVRLERITRTVAFKPTGPVCQTEALISLEAGEADFSQVADLAEAPSLVADGRSLTLIEATPVRPAPAPNRRQIELCFSGSPAVPRLTRLAGQVVTYRNSRRFQINFTELAPGVVSESYGLIAALERAEPGQDERGRAGYLVEISLSWRPELAELGQEPQTAWRDERLALVSSDGSTDPPRYLTREFTYRPGSRELSSIKLRAVFPAVETAPAGISYSVEGLQGLKRFPYRFTDIPLS